MPYDRYIDPIVAALAIVGAAHLLAAAMRAGRITLALAARVRMWWRWRVFLARPCRVEVA